MALGYLAPNFLLKDSIVQTKYCIWEFSQNWH